MDIVDLMRQFDPLTVTDHMWYAQWLLNRLSEEHDIIVSFENKPMKGDWNGEQVVIQTFQLRLYVMQTGKLEIHNAITRLADKHAEHVKIYGAGLDERLTGDHETCDINTFKHGNSDRGASIRIPISTVKKGYGYIEDRRPGANSDSYLVAAKIIATVCDIDLQESSQKKREGTCDCITMLALSNVWLLISAALVFLMHLGFASLEAGLTRSKNTVEYFCSKIWGYYL